MTHVLVKVTAIHGRTETEIHSSWPITPSPHVNNSGNQLYSLNWQWGFMMPTPPRSKGRSYQNQGEPPFHNEVCTWTFLSPGQSSGGGGSGEPDSKWRQSVKLGDSAACTSGLFRTCWCGRASLGWKCQLRREMIAWDVCLVTVQDE